MTALTFEAIREKLVTRFPCIGPTVEAKDPFVVLPAECLTKVCEALKGDPSLAFDYLIDITAVDYPAENLLRAVYHLWSLDHGHAFKLKVELPRQGARLPSVCALWPAANWLEREVFDLFGITFDGHPDLRRIMMPDDWVGHPLLKDFKESGGYHGISNVRPSPLQRYLEADRALRAASPGSVKWPEPPPAPPAPAAPSAPVLAAGEREGKAQ